MAFKKLSLDKLESQFGISNEVSKIIPVESITPVTPSAFLLEQLRIAEELPTFSEKAKSEFMVAPILMEARRISDKFFTIFSGETLSVDPENGLVGECDFLLTKASRSYSIKIPILSLVEAKRGDISLGVAQCAAQLYGAYLYNKRDNLELPRMYGCVTSGEGWKFMMLEEGTIKIDPVTYFYPPQLGLILGIFKHIMSYYRTILP